MTSLLSRINDAIGRLSLPSKSLLYCVINVGQKRAGISRVLEPSHEAASLSDNQVRLAVPIQVPDRQ